MTSRELLAGLPLTAAVLRAAIHIISGEDFRSLREKMQKVEDSKKSPSAQTRVELRQYSLDPGIRDTLIELFARDMESPLS
ncbi:MAG: hypothetical protein DME65_00715 [Verrucomicrobia bacterium]|nr:MAG: hypothetical protein DME65_00715 [Verrucomicrobiota bacterium]